MAERYIRILKEQPLWVPHFEVMEALQQPLQSFKQQHNQPWLVSKRNYVTPRQPPTLLK